MWCKERKYNRLNILKLQTKDNYINKFQKTRHRTNLHRTVNGIAYTLTVIYRFVCVEGVFRHMRSIYHQL